MGDATEVPSTSLGAAVILQQDIQRPTKDTDVVMRDGMLVRILHCKQEGFARYMGRNPLCGDYRCQTGGIEARAEFLIPVVDFAYPIGVRW